MKFKDLFKHTTYIIILVITLIVFACLILVNDKMRTMADDDEQHNAWQILTQTIKEADCVFDKNEAICLEFSEFSKPLKKDTTFLNTMLLRILRDNAELHASFIYFFNNQLDTTMLSGRYFVKNKHDIQKAAFKDYFSEAKLQFLQENLFANHKKIYWENPVVSSSDNQANIHLFVPISDTSATLQGFMGVSMNLSWLDQLLQTASEYYGNDPAAFLFALAPDGAAISVMSNILSKNQNLIEGAKLVDDANFASMLYKMRNGETGNIMLNSTVIGTTNRVFYKSLQNKKISIALSYHDNQAVIRWSQFFIFLMSAVFFFFVLITGWFWWHWKKRSEDFEKIGKVLEEVERGANSAVLPSSSDHDLQELCLTISNMQRGLDARNKETIANTQAEVRSSSERKLAQRIRRYFYNTDFQYYSNIASQKIDQALEADYLPDVSGDFHDYFNISSEQICFVAGTVSRPKKSMSNIQMGIDILLTMSLIRSHIGHYQSLNQAVFELNNELIRQNKKRFSVNLFIGVIDCVTGKFDFINAGGPQPYLIAHQSIIPFNIKHGRALASMENEEYLNGNQDLFNGDMILIYTAGLLSRQSAHSEKYGQQRLEKIIATSHMFKPNLIVEKIVGDIADFTNAQSVQVDDYTLFMVKYEDKATEIIINKNKS